MRNTSVLGKHCTVYTCFLPCRFFCYSTSELSMMVLWLKIDQNSLSCVIAAHTDPFSDSQIAHLYTVQSDLQAYTSISSLFASHLSAVSNHHFLTGFGGKKITHRVHFLSASLILLMFSAPVAFPPHHPLKLQCDDILPPRLKARWDLKLCPGWRTR